MVCTVIERTVVKRFLIIKEINGIVHSLDEHDL